MKKKTKTIIICVICAIILIILGSMAILDGFDVMVLTLAVFGPPILTGLLFVVCLIMFLTKRIDSEKGSSAKEGKGIKAYGVMALIYGAIFAATVVYTVMGFI